MEKKILEVNVDDLNMGGVYGLVKNVIINNENRNIQIDIASIEHFANRANIDMFNSIPVIFSNKITTSAKLTDNVSFLGIEAKDAAKWVDTIVCYKNKAINRKQAYFLLKEKNFSIQDTVNSFLKLYKG